MLGILLRCPLLVQRGRERVGSTHPAWSGISTLVNSRQILNLKIEPQVLKTAASDMEMLRQLSLPELFTNVVFFSWRSWKMNSLAILENKRQHELS